MTGDALLFFNDCPQSIPLYAAFDEALKNRLGQVTIRVQKTQITFSNRRVFAAASFLPARRAKNRPEAYLTVTFGLSRRVQSPRIDAAVEPYPNRWTHHALIAAPEEIDDELMDWVKEAARFSAGKR